MKRSVAVSALVFLCALTTAANAGPSSRGEIIACAFDAEEVRFSLNYPKGSDGCEVSRRADDGEDALVIWRATEDADLCRRKLRSLTKILSDHGWRCEGEPRRTSFLKASQRA